VKRLSAGILLLWMVSGNLLPPAGAEEKREGGYKLYEASAATVNGEVLFLSDIVREACLRGCGAFPGEYPVLLSLPEARDRLIADILVRQEEEKLGSGTVDNTALKQAEAGASIIMGRCLSPCAREMEDDHVRDYAARRLRVREFLRQRISVFVDVNEEEVEREIRRRASRSGESPGDIPEETVRRELFDQKAEREVRNWFDRVTSKSRILLSPLEER
jgi:hypothetical protein